MKYKLVGIPNLVAQHYTTKPPNAFFVYTTLILIIFRCLNMVPMEYTVLTYYGANHPEIPLSAKIFRLPRNSNGFLQKPTEFNGLPEKPTEFHWIPQELSEIAFHGMYQI